MTGQQAEQFSPTITVSIPCENGRCADCTGWVSAPFCGPRQFPCPCGNCAHPNAWTEQEATDRALGAYYRAYPGETLTLTYPRYHQHTLGTWPGSGLRPQVYFVPILRRPQDPDCEAYDLWVTLTHPTGNPERDRDRAADLAATAGHHVVPSMGGRPHCAMRVDNLGWFRERYAWTGSPRP